MVIIFEISIGLICLLWIILSIYKQFKSSAFNQNNDPFSMIPIWTLFSPSPLKNRSLIGYREKLKSGETSDIIIIDYFSPKWYFFLWYGQRRDVKLFLGVRRHLNQYRKSPHTFRNTTSFLLIKNYISSYGKIDHISERQIIYLKKGGFHLQKNEEVLFVTTVKL